MRDVREADSPGSYDAVVLGGRLDPSLATGLFDRMLAKRMPGDARNFDDIRAWARKVADALA